MIIHNSSDSSNNNTRTDNAFGKLKRWTWSHQFLLQLGVVVIVFLMGVLAQRQGVTQQLWDEIGLSNKNIVLTKNIIREPVIAFEAMMAAELPTLYIDMGFKQLQKIEAKREEALELGLLLASDDDFVPAEIRLHDRTVRVKMRLKGDLTDHLKTEKWSYRIHVKDDDQLFGMRRISIQPPETRKYLLEWGWLETLRHDGVLAPRYQFVQVVFNGVPKGIYALEEHFSKELLESQQRREGVIITFDESAYWERYAQLGVAPSWFDFVTNVSDYRNALIETNRSGRVDADPVLSQERDMALGLLRAFQEGKLPTSDVFDAELLGRFLAISELWQAYHGLYWNNMHFYYNPITAKLEPIGFDGTPDKEPARVLHVLGGEPWLAQALEDPIIAASYVKGLDRVSQPEYLHRLKTQLDAPLNQLRLALFSEFSSFVYSTSVWDILSKRQEYIRHSLDVKSPVFAVTDNRIQTNKVGYNSTIKVTVRNILALPVEILGFQVGETFIAVDDVQVNPKEQSSSRDGQSSIILAGIQRESDEPVKFVNFEVPVEATQFNVKDGQMPDVKVVARLLGMPTRLVTPVRQYPQALTSFPLSSMPTVSQILSQYPFLKQGETEGTLIIYEGDWDITDDLVLPRGVRLQVESGATLRFGTNAKLVATGPLDFRGTAEAPVKLVPMNDSWEGIVVIEAKELSTWENVLIKNTRGIQDGGWILTGGVTFYESPIHLVRSHIFGSEAEDGINIVRSSFEFRDCEFSKFASDAFDGDFTKGEIRNCSFHEVYGDALDLSGSQISVSNVVFRDIGDKGISAGEVSEVDARDLIFSKTGIGVASKDLSHVELQHVKINQVIHAGLAAYEKKQEYGPASINAVDVEFDEFSQNTLVQEGSWIILNNRRVDGSKIDVEALYTAGILGN